jgi:tripartite-type tricarboxylate transporter receptor subunit TctC
MRSRVRRVGFRRTFWRILLWLAAWTLVSTPQAAPQAYPDGKLIRLATGAAAGSATDIIARALGETLKSELGVTVLVENRSGATGVIAGRSVLAAPADGHTILIQTGAHTIVPYLMKVEYDPLRDFSGVATVASVPSILVVPRSSPFKAVHDLVAAAKADPGKLNYASLGPGSATFMSAEKFHRAAGIKATNVTFRGANEAVTETMGERIDYVFAPLLAALPQIEAGTLKALAVGSRNRLSQLPDVPTLSETGIANAEYLFWVGLLVASQTPRDIVQKLSHAVSKALETSEFRARLAALAVEPMAMGPQEFDALLREESRSAAEFFGSAEPKQ